jgi:hypothetical protein
MMSAAALSHEEWSALTDAANQGTDEPLVELVERIIASRLAAAEARAEAAERKVAAALALLNYYDRLDGYVPTADLRAALDTAADPDTPTPTRWERA